MNKNELNIILLFTYLVGLISLKLNGNSSYKHFSIILDKIDLLCVPPHFKPIDLINIYKDEIGFIKYLIDIVKTSNDMNINEMVDGIEKYYMEYKNDNNN